MIGNPPYIKEYTNKSVFDGFRKSKYYQGKMDLWYGFSCMMINNLKEKGIECFIAQNNWITSAGASKLRQKILSETQIKSFVDFGNYKVFQSAGIQTMIYVVQKRNLIQNIESKFYNVRYSVLLEDKINDKELSDFLDFDEQNNHSQKYLFEMNTDLISDRPFTFNTNDDESILNKISNASNYKFSEKEIAQGIVPNPDVVNKRNFEKIPLDIIEKFNIKINDGVFVINRDTFKDIPINEKKYIKPLFEPREVERYKSLNDYESELIYITKSNYKNDAPHLINHLEKYRSIMDDRRENQNGRLDFFHLHWSRDESYFSEGPKVLVVRKCSKPTFIYTTNPAYVMMSFNIIKSNIINAKYSTALLNSKLIAFWLRNKGNMQGNNFQLDKAPLLNIPLFIPEKTIHFETLVDYLLVLNKLKTNLNPQVLNSHIIETFEEVVDAMVFELYFPNEFAATGIEFLKYAERDFKSIDGLDSEQQKKVIHDVYQKLREKNNEIRNNIKLMKTKLHDLLMPILKV